MGVSFWVYGILGEGHGDTEKHLIKWFRGNDDDSEVISDELADSSYF